MLPDKEIASLLEDFYRPGIDEQESYLNDAASAILLLLCAIVVCGFCFLAGYLIHA